MPFFAIRSVDETKSSFTGTRARLGKARASLSQEYFLAQFISNFTNLDSSWNVNIPVCNWVGIDCIREGEVAHIYWSIHRLYGIPQWNSLPCTLQHLYLDTNKLSGTIHMEDLPRQIACVNVGGNLFSGEVDLFFLSDTMRSLCILYNSFEGPLDVTRLPQNFKVLDASSNQFTGRLNLLHLPPVMERIAVSNNDFSGSVDLDHLPCDLSLFDISNNPNLFGTYRPSTLPAHLRERSLLFILFVYAIDEDTFRVKGTKLAKAVDRTCCI